MAALHEKNKLYSILRPIVDFHLKYYAYRHYDVVGRENLPKDGMLIYGPNHANCLMDALVVLALDRERKVFIARADIFKSPKVRKLLEFFKIMPMNRARDGRMSVLENDYTYDTSVAALSAGVPLCLMPEGRHRPMHSLLPLGKGLIRIALKAHEANPDKKLYIQPVGLEYEDYFRYHNDVLVTYGKPIELGEFKQSLGDVPEPVVMSKFNELLAHRMKDTILYVKDDEWYDATMLLVALNFNEKTKRKDALAEKQALAKRVADLRANDATFEEGMLTEARKLADELNAAGVDLFTVYRPGHYKWHILELLSNVIFLGYLLGCFVLSAPTCIISELIGRKIKDKAFVNSVRFVVQLLVWPLTFIIYSIVMALTTPWYVALSSIIFALPAMTITHSVVRDIRLLISDQKYRRIIKKYDLNKFKI